MTIWKFPIYQGLTSVPLPVGAEIIHFDVRDGRPQIWAYCDPNRSVEYRDFQLVGTGWTFDADWRHVGTVVDQLDTGLVWHLLEKQ